MDKICTIGELIDVLGGFDKNTKLDSIKFSASRGTVEVPPEYYGQEDVGQRCFAPERTSYYEIALSFKQESRRVEAETI
jgi:hypothetical protein